jgi:CRISPR/Cas system-associated endoribonuclease Cas2
MKARLILASIILGGMVYTTNAQTATPKVDARQENQKERIQEGVRSGEITKPEAKKLRAQQKHIRRTERAMKADGQMTKKEKKVLDRKQDRASENIKHENHDGHNHK